MYDSVWGHIDDLRRTLIRTFWIVGIGFALTLCFYEPIVQVLFSLTKENDAGLIKQKFERIEVYNPTSSALSFRLPDKAHLVFFNGNQVEEELYHVSPGDKLIFDQPIRSPLLIMGPVEGLVLVFKACFWLSLVWTAPLWGWIWLQFILPGVHQQERAILVPFIVCSLICIVCGCLLAYYVTLPLANDYLSLFNSSIGQNAWTLNHYVNYVMFLCLGHAIAAELALILIILVHFRFLSPEWMISKRRHAIVAAFILGALLTPPDVLTQVLLAIPLIIIYELAICYAKWRCKDQAY